MQTVLDEMSGVTIYQNEELHLLGPSSFNISQLGSSNNLKRPIILIYLEFKFGVVKDLT